MSKPAVTGVNLENFARPGGMDFRAYGAGGSIFCGSAHPTDKYTWCRRFKEHDGDCAAFVHSISTPDTWARAATIEEPPASSSD